MNEKFDNTFSNTIVVIIGTVVRTLERSIVVFWDGLRNTTIHGTPSLLVMARDAAADRRMEASLQKEEAERLSVLKAMEEATKERRQLRAALTEARSLHSAEALPSAQPSLLFCQ